jgi:uncharacterized protein (DUF302 family)
MTTALGADVVLDANFDVAIDRVRSALAEFGFGVLTEIDVQATMRAKLDVQMERFTILGACNPPLAYRALTTEPSLGLLLPCNVTVRETPDGVVVQVVDPQLMLGAAPQADLSDVAGEASRRLSAALDLLRGGATTA